MDIAQFLENGHITYLPNLSIDLIIIGYKRDKLMCLLLKVDKKWMLPGGYIGIKESVNNAVIRILKERTSLEKPHFKFLSVFGNENREFKTVFKELITKSNHKWNDDFWINKRFVTLTYYSLVHMDQITSVAGIMDEDIAWFDFEELPEIWMDHESILLKARNHLREDLKHEQLTYNLLPKTFTMPELHHLHQTILGTSLDRSRFQKKMLATGLFERLPKKTKKDTPGRIPYVYQIKPDTV